MLPDYRQNCPFSGVKSGEHRRLKHKILKHIEEEAWSNKAAPLNSSTVRLKGGCEEGKHAYTITHISIHTKLTV